MTLQSVIAGESSYSVSCSDAADFLDSLPRQSVSLLFSSPPYELARDYLEGGKNLGIARSTEEWVKWMVTLTHKALRVTTGLVAWVIEGQTKDFRYTASPLLLAADLSRSGVCLRKPPLYVRDGIPGSGGPDWLKNRYEFIICCTNGGKLPWSDNTACGHPPLLGRGGPVSHRAASGKRKTFTVQTRREASGKRDVPTDTDRGRPLPDLANPGNLIDTHFRHAADGTVKGGHARDICETANPGNVIDFEKPKHFGHAKDGQVKGGGVVCDIVNPGNTIEPLYTAAEVRAILASHGIHDDAASNLIDCGSAGGGNISRSAIAHENEAPFPESLVEFFVKSFAPINSIVCDPFLGSGTTLVVAQRHNRRFVGADLRQSQVELSNRRIIDELGMFSSPTLDNG